jgi:hypothetical protein
VKTKALRNAVDVVLADAAANKRPAFTEQQFLREVVDFANSGEMPNVLASDPNPIMHVDADTMDGVRRGFRADLQALIDGRLTTADKKRIYAAADRMLMIPRTRDDRTVIYRFVPANFEAAVAHAMRLLIASPPDQQEDLKQCQWKDCNRDEDAPEVPYVRRFFFVSQRREAQEAAGKERTGKLPDRYCCEEHMRAAHRVRATEATIARRQKLKEQKQQAAHAAAKHK